MMILRNIPGHIDYTEEDCVCLLDKQGMEVWRIIKSYPIVC